MKLYGYGEDALTLFVLRMKMDEVLHQLGDPSRVEDVVALYRPSFGRGGSGQFGEFDAIVATDIAIYLIESKWTRSAEVTSKEIRLREEQATRHKEFRNRLEQWRRNPAAGLDSFLNEGALLQIKSTSRLARNLHYVFDMIGSNAKPMRDVLLLLCVGRKTCQDTTPPAGFSLVRIVCEETGFVDLSGTSTG